MLFLTDGRLWSDVFKEVLGGLEGGVWLFLLMAEFWKKELQSINMKYVKTNNFCHYMLFKSKL